MQTRSEAVEYLKQRGLHAAERDWALGETVVVATGGSVHDDITVYERAIYIVPKDGGWTTFDLDRPDPRTPVLSLADACARAERILTGPRDDPRDERR